MENKIRLELRFTGRVQGVGFRYTATYAANNLGLTGWVYNDWDGSVLMEVQGAKSQINRLIEHLNNGRFIQIDNIEKKVIPLNNHETIFEEKPSAY